MGRILGYKKLENNLTRRKISLKFAKTNLYLLKFSVLWGGF
jgi:hypothetical protein